MGMIDFLSVSPITPKLQNGLLQLMALSLGYKSKVKYYIDRSTTAVHTFRAFGPGFFGLHARQRVVSLFTITLASLPILYI